MDGGWSVSTGECPCGQGRKQTTLTCNDPEPANGGDNCNCEDARIVNADEITMECDGYTVTIEEDCQNEPCPGIIICTGYHIKTL